MRVEITKNSEITPDYRILAVNSPEIAGHAKAGQFVMVRILLDSFDPFLRRPFSIMKVDGPSVEILYKIVGKGTRILSGLEPGNYLGMVGPLGRGFEPDLKSHRAILAGGGVGIPPLYFLAETLLAFDNIDLNIFLGGRTRADLLLLDEFCNLGARVFTATDDGSAGQKGLVTDPLEDFLKNHPMKPSIIYSCGPEPMLKTIAGIANAFKIPAKVSLEEKMGCGIGACLGCVVETNPGLQRVCKDGPVFDSKEILKFQSPPPKSCDT